jgi:L,D-peptidoglycan transpeptidase YkuD (ErfK/YbiS/YcfS/YnhG family)
VARVRGAGARQQEVNAARVERSERASCDAARVARGASVRARFRAAERRGASALGERGATRPKQERSSVSGAATAQASGMERAECVRAGGVRDDVRRS